MLVSGLQPLLVTHQPINHTFWLSFHLYPDCSYHLPSSPSGVSCSSWHRFPWVYIPIFPYHGVPFVGRLVIVFRKFPYYCWPLVRVPVYACWRFSKFFSLGVVVRSFADISLTQSRSFVTHQWLCRESE